MLLCCLPSYRGRLFAIGALLVVALLPATVRKKKKSFAWPSNKDVRTPHMSSVPTPFLTADWLAALPNGRQMSAFAKAAARNGYETTFAVGLIESMDDIIALGVWVDDAESVAPALHGPRSLVAHWTPAIADIPTTRPVAVWLSNLPVPALASYAPMLASLGYDSLGALRHVQAEDVRAFMPDGHSRALCHCVGSMNIAQDPPPIEVPLETWLCHLRPPLPQYTSTLKLEGVLSVVDLLLLPRERFEALVMRIGHRRALWHYAVVARTRYITIL